MNSSPHSAVHATAQVAGHSPLSPSVAFAFADPPNWLSFPVNCASAFDPSRCPSAIPLFFRPHIHCLRSPPLRPGVFALLLVEHAREKKPRLGGAEAAEHSFKSTLLNRALESPVLPSTLSVVRVVKRPQPLCSSLKVVLDLENTSNPGEEAADFLRLLQQERRWRRRRGEWAFAPCGASDFLGGRKAAVLPPTGPLNHPRPPPPPPPPPFRRPSTPGRVHPPCTPCLYTVYTADDTVAAYSLSPRACLLRLRRITPASPMPQYAKGREL
jgi:hypothetical protein